MHVHNRWMQKGTRDRRDRSNPPCCTTTRDDRSIAHMAAMDRGSSSRTIAQILFAAHYSVSARNIRRRLQQIGMSSRSPMLHLTLTENHRRQRRQWWEEWWTWTTEQNVFVLTDESRFCLKNYDGQIRVRRHHGERLLNCYVMRRHTSPARDIMV